MSTLSFDPLISPAVWVTLAVLAVGLLGWYALRRPGHVPQRRWLGTVGLMGACVAAVLGLLLNPTWVREVPPPAGKPLLTVLVDSSASMAAGDAQDGRSRYQAAGQTAAALARKLGGRFDVRVRTFAGSLAATDAADVAAGRPEGQTTDLAEAIAGGLEADRPQGQALVLFSDGIHNAGGGSPAVLAAARLAKSMAAPVYTRTIGGAISGFDLGVALRSPQELAFVGQRVPVSVAVSHPGLGNGQVDVQLLHEGQEITRQRAMLSEGGSSDVRFEVQQEKTGLYRYEVRVAALSGELTTVNNTAAFQLRVVDEPIRILLLEGKPYWDSKFLMRTLTLDPSVELDSVVKLATGRLMRRSLARAAATQSAATAPAAREEQWKVENDPAEVLASADRLKRYQIVVLGRNAEEFLTDAGVTNLQNWIAREGGSVVCYRGAPVAQVNQQLARLLPVKWAPARESRLRLRLTEQGREVQWLGGDAMSRLPTLASGAQVDSSKPLTVVLATSSGASGEETPAICYQPYGSGRVVVIEGAGMWRWAFLSPQFQENDEVYSGVWHSLLRWLASNAGLLPGQKLALRADRVSFGTGEAATAMLLLRGESGAAQPPAVELAGPDGKPAGSFTPAPAGDDPGAYRVVFGKLREGRYEARVSGEGGKDPAGRTLFDVRSFGEEQLNLKARPDLMARVSEDSGGAVLEGDSSDEIARRFQEHLDRSRPRRVEREMAWDRWWVMAGVLALWGVTWAVRRSGGLV